MVLEGGGSGPQKFGNADVKINTSKRRISVRSEDCIGVSDTLINGALCRGVTSLRRYDARGIDLDRALDITEKVFCCCYFSSNLFLF